MINEKDKPVEWALLLYDLDDAREQLASLVDQMNKDGRIDEEEYAVRLGDVFAKLNRGWNARDHVGEISDSDFDRFSRFPSDLDPVG